MLLSQTVDGQHKLTSGDLDFSVVLTPTGSSVITAPITLSVSGPFQSDGKGKLPTADLTLSGSAQGQKGTLELILTGGNAYVTADGQSYAIPASDLAQLKSQLGSANATKSQRAGTQLFSKLGIDVTDWLKDPKVVGTASVDGASTTHLHATLSIAAVITDADKLLGSVAGSSSTSALGGAIPTKIPATAATKVEQELGSPSIDLWTGNSDKIIRRLRITATLPISGSISSEIGGLTSVGIAIDYDISDVNQPQTVTAPTSVKPISQFITKLKSLVQGLTGGLLGSSLAQGAISGTGGGTSITGGALSGGTGQKYAECVHKAGGDVTKLQKCTTLLGAG